MAEQEQLSIPDLPRGADQGVFFKQYIKEKYIAKENFGFVIYDSSQSPADRVVQQDGMRITITKNGTGTLRVKGGARGYLVEVLGKNAADNQPTDATIQVYYDNFDVIIKRKLNNVLQDGVVLIKVLKI